MLPPINEKLLQENEHVRANRTLEAMQAGTAALESLERVRAELRSAEDVRTDEELGDVVRATKEQLSRIDSASHHAHSTQQLLYKFQEALTDPSLRVFVSVHVEAFSKFAKSFLEGPISDWVVKSKIQAASSSCATMIAAISATLAECQRQLDEVERNT